MKLRKILASGILALVIGGTAVVCITQITGCAALGIQKAETFEERVILAQSGVKVAQNALEAKIDAQSISKKNAVNTDAQLDKAIEGLDIAIELRQSGDPEAEGKLEATAAIVAALRKQLGV